MRKYKAILKDVRRLIDAIRFSEFNISLDRTPLNRLSPDLVDDMQQAITRFNERLRHAEVQQHFYDMLLNRIDTAIVVTDRAGRIKWINKAAINEFGPPQPHTIADCAHVSPELPDVLENITPKESKIIRIYQDQTPHDLVVSAIVFVSSGEELKLISFKNIHDVLEESESDAWKKLIRVLTHEMMNSLTPIISLSESFAEQTDTGTVDVALMERAMKTIHRRSKGLVQFVENYRKLTRIPPPDYSSFPAQALIDDIASLLSADGIRFACDIVPADLLLHADRTQLEQVLINLIKNAWEACAERKLPDIKVHLSQSYSQKFMIVISDNGCGILPEVLDKIFVPFFTTKAGGSGIGLSICRQILSLHGGSITATSEVGVGSSFTVRW